MNPDRDGSLRGTRMYQSKRWILSPIDPRARELAERLKTSPLVAQILLNRGLVELDQCLTFLRPSLSSLHDPSLLPNLSHAAARIAQAIRDRQKIVLYGDYDVDGITAVAILWRAIKQLGGEVDSYIPHRLEEGYGLNSEAVTQICNAGAKLIVTVDCGVTATEPARLAGERGVDLIITDHHDFRRGHQAGMPECFAIVHPRLPLHDSPAYPNPHLCGAGVAFKLAWGVGQAISGANRVDPDFRNFLIDATALAALGTIADVVPLTEENRVLAHFGLGGLKASKLTGIRALINSAGLDGQKLDSYHVGFLLAPRLNACGRMGHARLAVELFTDATPDRASEIAKFLEQQNRQRQTIERQIFEESISQIEQMGFNSPDCRALVLGSESWHAGVIGIVASRLVERFNRPAVLVALSNGCGQGSGRSIAGFHLARALEECGQYLDAFGGHEMAAGLKIRSENFDAFRQAFCAHASGIVTPQMLLGELKLECLADLQQMTEPLVAELKRLGPFGHGNRPPTLCIRNVELAAPPRVVGKSGDHLQLYVRQSNLHMKCIAFGAAPLADKLQAGVRLDLAVRPQVNQFNGSSSVELEIRDFQFA